MQIYCQVACTFPNISWSKIVIKMNIGARFAKYVSVQYKDAVVTFFAPCSDRAYLLLK